MSMFDVIEFSAPPWREQTVFLTRPAAFLTVFCLLWFGPLALLNKLYLIIFFGGGEGIRRIPIYFLSAQFTLLALNLAFQAAILIRVGAVGKQYVQRFWRTQTPPHRRRKPSSTLPVIYRRATRKAKSKAKLWFGLGVVTLLLSNIGYYEWIHFNPDPILPQLPVFPLEVLGAVLTYFTTLPVTPLTEPVFSEMNSITLVSNALLVWLPAIPLAIGFLNLNAYLYRRTQLELFWWLREFRLV